MFFEHYYDRVYAHVVNLLRDPVLGQDLTQDVFMRLHKVIDRLDTDRDPSGWVFTVATNVVRDHWRSAEHKRKEAEKGTGDPTDLNLAHPDSDVQAAMEKDEDLRAVWAALHTLSLDDREIILLRDYEELPTAEIGQMLELNQDAVRQRHSRAVARLGKAFDKNRPEEATEK
jgi:RNA polymerase sigma-70 factor (ECF subfamily)